MTTECVTCKKCAILKKADVDYGSVNAQLKLLLDFVFTAMLFVFFFTAREYSRAVFDRDHPHPLSPFDQAQHTQTAVYLADRNAYATQVVNFYAMHMWLFGGILVILLMIELVVIFLPSIDYRRRHMLSPSGRFP